MTNGAVIDRNKNKLNFAVVDVKLDFMPHFAGIKCGFTPPKNTWMR